MRDFYYLVNTGAVIRITASKKPSAKAKPKSGTWVVKEFTGEYWRTPSFPEITWNQLSKFTYIGSIRQAKGGVLE